MKIPFVTGACLLSLAAAAMSQDAADVFNPLGRDLPDILPKQLRIQVEWIEVSHETFTRLMAEAARDGNHPPYLPSNDTPLRQALAELAAKGEARVLDTALVAARSGQRAKVESIHEYIYPTEYDPALACKPGEGGKKADPGQGNRLPTPALFETRNVGTTLEVDPVLGVDELTIDLNLAPEIVYLAGESEWGEYESPDGRLKIKMPSFYTMKATTQVTLVAGEPCLIAAVSPHHAESGMPDRERKVMVFVKSDVIAVGLAPEEDGTDPE